jgi:hypothetical protein
VRRNRVKLAAAGIGASAAVVMGALGASLAAAPTGTATFSEAPDITLGETTTQSVAPTEMETSFAVPPVTAERPDGFDQGG